MALYKENERICRELGDKVKLQAFLGNQALILKARGEIDKAMKLLKEKECICRELGRKKSLSKSLGIQANILSDQGNLDGALALLKEQEQLCRELGDKEGLVDSIGNQANILYYRDDLYGSMLLHKEVENLCRELGNKHGLQASLGNQALILKARGELDDAMRILKEQELICRELKIPDGLATSLANQALFLAEEIGQPHEAIPLAEEAYRLATDHGLTVLAQQFKPLLDYIRFEISQTQTKANVMSEYEIIHLPNIPAEREYIKKLYCEFCGGQINGNRVGSHPAADGQMQDFWDIKCTKCGKTNRIILSVPSLKSIDDLLAMFDLNKQTTIEPNKQAPVIATPHHDADPNRASQLNKQYQEELAKWKALPLWKRLKTKKPEPPKGI